MTSDPRKPRRFPRPHPVTVNVGTVTGGNVIGVLRGSLTLAAPAPASPPSRSAPPAPFTSAPSTRFAPSPPRASSPCAQPARLAAIDILYIAAPADDLHRATLSLHLAPTVRQQDLTEWRAGDPPPGELSSADPEALLRSARLVVLLLSPDYFADERCRRLHGLVLERIRSDLQVVPVRVRPVARASLASLSGLAHLPRGFRGKPVVEWRSRDAAWADVATGLSAALLPVPARAR